MPGPLSGLRVLELQGRGPAPFGTMVLADLGADVLTVSRVADVAASGAESGFERLLRGHRAKDLVTRGKRSVAIDLKHPAGLDAALRLADRADVFVEGNRPGVAERLGIGPDVCLARNPALVYARMTGWGQEGPLAHTPGHDINYVAMAGPLAHIRRPGEAPMPPLNLLGDYGGGGMLLVAGVLSALFERSRSGRGQVVDTAMVDGVALLSTLFHGLRAEGLWSDAPGSNILDLGAPHYNVYETADGRHVSVGAGEPQFYRQLLERLSALDEGLAEGLADELLAAQGDASVWARNTERLAAVFRTRTLAQWCELLEGTDTCFAPVLTMGEATTHPHNVARKTFVDVDGVVQPNAAPRFSRTPADAPGSAVQAGGQTVAALTDWGFDGAEIDGLVDARAVAQDPRPVEGRGQVAG